MPGDILARIRRASFRSLYPMDSSAPGGISPDPMAALPQPPALDNTFGALLIGCFVGFIQYGWTVNQCYRYFSTYPNDRRILKSLVCTVLILETFHTVLCMHICYYYLIKSYFNPLALEKAVWSINLLGVVTVRRCYSGFAELFLAASLDDRSEVQTSGDSCRILLFGEFGFATAVTVDTFLQPTLHNNNQAWMNSAGVGMAVLADSILTAALIFSLHRSRTGIRRTDSIIDLLIMYAINTGLVTGVTNLLSLVFALAMPNNLLYAGIVIVATKLYANSMMAVLNSRRSLAGDRTIPYTAPSQDVFRSHLARSRSAGRWTRSALTSSPATPTVIDVKVTQETCMDAGQSTGCYEIEELKVETVEAV
ncbi:hypothetical protein C2E23DRAFT_887305 [Lenzites betulinus]|nr:hypothetical protein C2E23DRAFT_887305 [Lenzites betulinus]